MPGLSLFETILVAIIVPQFVSRYIGTYTEFRKEMIKARRHFRLYSNIYSNFFFINDVSPDFVQKVIGVQESLRIIWVDMETNYLLIPNELRWLLIHLRKLPKKEHLETKLSTFIGIHNSTIIYYSEPNKIMYGRDELNKRNEQIEEVQKFIKRYI